MENDEKYTENQEDWRNKYHFDEVEEIQETPIQPKVKKSRGILKKLGTGLLICVLGVSSGFGGSYLYQKTLGANTSTNGSVVIQETHSPVVNNNTISTNDNKEDVISSVSDSVVQIETEAIKTGSFWGDYITSGAGSGVIITANGYIVTNNHVIDGATKIAVTLADGSEYEGTIIGSDAENDLAVIKIEATGLTPAVMGDSDQLKVGQTVLAIGNPLGTFGGSVTSGIVSALSRNVNVEGTQMTLLQIDAAINPGNSGGALFDLNGNLVGVVNAKYRSSDVEGIGFAIPINTAKTVIEQLISQGYVSGKVQLGIEIRNIPNEQYAYQYGVDEPGIYIVKILEGSDAEKGGLQVGDRIVKVDGNEINSAEEISPLVKEHVPGEDVVLTIVREGVQKDITITLTEHR